MRVKQFIGPFSAGTQLNVGSSLSGATFVKIGIEHPRTPPYEEILNKNPVGYDIILKINGSQYAITERDILEFDNLSTANMIIDIVDVNNPYLLINIGYN